MTPTDGQKNSNNRLCNTTVSFNCSDCYKLEGYDQLSCLPNNLWSSQEPVCTCKFVCIIEGIISGFYIECLNLYLSLLLSSVVKNCSVLSTPSNGLKNTNSSSCGTVVDFSCNECYELEGTEQLSCLPNTSWSHEEPRCNCKICINYCLRLFLTFVTTLL